MNLINCENCGVVLNKDDVGFPVQIEFEDGIDDSKAAWNGEEYVAKIQCPVCQSDILEHQ